jgi:Zn-dependent M28 family amino/carboxypeptidase
MKEGRLIRFLIVALPAGLLFMGVFSMVNSHFYDKESELDPNEEIRLDAASLNRRPVNRVDLGKSLEILATRIGERHLGKPDQLENAAVWIESSLSGANLGYVVERHPYEADGKAVRNLIAELPGRERREEIIVVGAHYDTVPGSPGANDNGSGIAALLALARAYAGDAQGRTIRFVAFVNEEAPYFQTEAMGSLVYARACRARQENIVAMLCLESIGYYSDEEGSQKIPPGLEGTFPKVGNFLTFVGNESSRYLVDAAKSAFHSASKIPALGGVFPEEVPGVGWSDHWSFWQAGFPAVMITDTASYRYPYYHLATDTPDKINLEKLEDATRGVEAIISALANP